jgi:cAMP-dependent protein kinase regulator
MSVVTSNILFSSYASDEHAAIVDAFEPVTVSAGTKVITQGESGDNFYVIQNGVFDIFIRGNQGEQKVGSSLTQGNSFGELALMYNTPRAATIKAVSNATVWQIDRHTYRKIVVHYKFLRNQQYKEFIRNVEMNGKKLSNILSEGCFHIFSFSYLTLYCPISSSGKDDYSSGERGVQ